MEDDGPARERLTPSALLTTGALLAPVVAAVCLAFRSGGYFITSWGTAALILLGLLAAVVLATQVSWGGRLGAIALGGWVGLAAWQGISAAWGYQPSAAIEAMNQTLLYAAAFALALVGVRRASDLTLLLQASLVGSAVIAAYALASRLLSSLVSGDLHPRLSTPISYWNGLGAVAAFGVVLALGEIANPARATWVRAASAALVPMLLLTLLLTFSRGAALAMLVGVVLLVGIVPGRIETISTSIVAMASSAPLLVLANSEDSIAVFDGILEPDPDAGRRVLLALLITMITVGAVSSLVAHQLRRLPAGARRPTGLALTACALIALATVGAVRVPQGGPIDWADRQFDSFRAYDATARNEAESVADRLAVAAGSGRWQNWGVAVDEFQEAPFVGTGAGGYRFAWESGRDIDLTVRNAHSLHLEVLGESGVVGLVLLLTPIIAVITALGLADRRGPPPGRLRDPAVAVAAGAVVGVHLIGDWTWQLPAVALPAMALGGGALAASRLTSRRPIPVPAAGRVLVGAIAVAAALLLVGAVASAVVTDDARGRAARGELQTALAAAEAAQRLDPWDPQPRLLRANILSDLGRSAESDQAFAQAVARAPRDWTIFADWASSSLRRGDVVAARIAARRARALNPLEDRPRLILEAAAP